MTGFRDGRAKLWSAHTGRLMKTYKKPVQPGAGIITADATSRASLGATSPDGKLTAEVANSRTATLYDTTGRTAWSSAPPTPVRRALPSIEPEVAAAVPRDCCLRPVIRVS